MSVNYTAKYGYGYIVSAKDVEVMPQSIYDEFIDSVFTTALNSYDSDDGFFFGLILHSAVPGYAIPIPSIDNYSHNDCVQMLKEFRAYFPNKSPMAIKHYLLNVLN